MVSIPSQKFEKSIHFKFYIISLYAGCPAELQEIVRMLHLQKPPLCYVIQHFIEPLKVIDWFLLAYCLPIHAAACGMLTQSCQQVGVCTVVVVCLFVMHSRRYSVVSGQKGRLCMCVRVLGSNWDELVLIGLYGMFGVISVWGLLWRPGSSRGWLGPPPSAEAVLHFLLCSFILVLAHPLSLLLLLTFPPLCRERERAIIWHRESEWVFVFPPALLPLSALWFNRASGSPSTHPSPLIAEFHFKGPSE